LLDDQLLNSTHKLVDRGPAAEAVQVLDEGTFGTESPSERLKITQD